MATSRSIPTVTSRELEILRSELQSCISRLEATLSGKEAEVMALKHAVTDAAVRVGKNSEELRNERAPQESLCSIEERTRRLHLVYRLGCASGRTLWDDLSKIALDDPDR